MKNRGLVYTFVTIFAFFTSISAFSDPIATDRPDTAEGSTTVTMTEFQIESGFALRHDRNAGVTTNIYALPTLLRYGLFDDFELRAEGDILSIRSQTGTSSKTGIGDIGLGAKFHWLDENGMIPSFGIMGQIIMPTGHNAVSQNAWIPQVKALADWTFTEDMALGTNIGVNVRGLDHPNPVYMDFLYAISLNHRLPWVSPKLSAFLEVDGSIPTNSTVADDAHSLNTGVMFGVTDNLSLDLYGKFGLTGPVADVEGGAGFSWRF